MIDAAGLQRDLDAVAARGRRHLYGWGVSRSLRDTLGAASMLLPCVPLLWVLWQVIAGLEPASAPAPGAGLVLLLMVLLPVGFAAIRMRAALLGRNIERLTALAAIDRQIDNRDRFTTAQEFLRKETRTGFEQAALGSAAEQIQQALHVELEPVSKPALGFSRHSLVCVVVAVALWLLGIWLHVAVQSGAGVRHRIADASSTTAPAPSPRLAPEKSPSEPPRAKDRHNDRASREQGGHEQTGREQSGRERIGGDGESSASGGSSISSAAASRSASAANGGAGTQDTASSQQLTDGSANVSSPSSVRAQAEAGLSGNAGSGAGAGAAGSESGGATNAGAAAGGNQGDQSSGKADGGEGEGAGSGTQGNEGAGGNGGDTPGAASSGVSDGAGPHVTGGVKRSRGVASMILGVPIQDRIEGLPNAGRTRVTRAETTPTAEPASDANAQDRGARSSAIGPLAQPQLTPWMRQVVERYFDSHSQSQP